MRYLKRFENLNNNDIKNKMAHIVNSLTLKYRRGNIFFDKLDEEIKKIENRDIILKLVENCSNEYITSSGEFGDILYQLYLDNKFSCKGMVVFNGKMLTNNIGVESWKPNDFDINNKEFVYIDDSYFSGGTVNKIDEFLHEHNSSIKKVNIMYDGSELKLDNVNSFYRYWDHRDLKEYKSKT